MATLEEITGIENFIRRRIVEDRVSHKRLSEELMSMYPHIKRGLSQMSVRRFCDAHNIHGTSRLTDAELDTAVSGCIKKVGSSYGRRTMTGLLAADGIRVCQLRVGSSLKRIDPASHHRRYTTTYRLINPIPYQSSYCGEKLHIDQNEKLVMFGVTHVCAVDGHSGKIVSFVTMPVKNNAIIYEQMYRPLVVEYGLWNQIRVDKGREWFLMLYIQQKLERHRYNTTKPSYLQTSSKQNHMVERIWVEVNTRVNYPVKAVLLEMLEQGDINLDDSLHKFCTSWFSIKVVSVGIDLFIKSWNNHPIPGRRRAGMATHIPNRIMASHLDRLPKLNQLSLLPDTMAAVAMYNQEGGNISDGAQFGYDPLDGDANKTSIRNQAFNGRYPSFEHIFHQLVNSNSTPFKEALKFYLDVTFRLSKSTVL